MLVLWSDSLIFIYFSTICFLVVASLFWQNFLNFFFFFFCIDIFILLAYFILNPFCPLPWCGRESYLAVWRGVLGRLSSLVPSLLEIIASNSWGFPSGSVVEESACTAGAAGVVGSIPGSGRSPGGGHGNLLLPRQSHGQRSLADCSS